MPRRTNKFQQVIYAIKSHLASEAVVTESAMLLDKATGDLREVDVTIQSSSGGHQQIVKIECRDHKRRQTVSWIDEMWGKHRDLPVGILVLASSSGFTKAARALADKRRIELLELTASPEMAARIAKRVRGMQVRGTRLDPVTVVAYMESPDGNSIESPPIYRNHEFYFEDGTYALSGHHVAQAYLQLGLDELGSNETVQGDMENEPFTFIVKPPTFQRNNDRKAHHLYMRRGGPDGELWKMIEIRLVVNTSILTNDIDWSHGTLASTNVSYGETTVFNDGLLFVATDDESGESLSVRTSSGTLHKIPQADEAGP